jgi:hypothetical protein
MSDGLDDLLGENGSEPGSQNQGGKLREQLERVLAENKALNERLAKQDAEARERGVADLFAKHSIPDLAKDFFPKDGDLNDEAATAFVEKYGQLWGAQAAPATTTPEQQAQTTAAQRLAQNASPPTIAPMSEAEYAQKFAEAKNPDELYRLIEEYAVIEAGRQA